MINPIRALEIVYDLAIENYLDERTAKENNLEEIYEEQQQAFEYVQTFIDKLDNLDKDKYLQIRQWLHEVVIPKQD